MSVTLVNLAFITLKNTLFYHPYLSSSMQWNQLRTKSINAACFFPLLRDADAFCHTYFVSCNYLYLSIVYGLLGVLMIFDEYEC